MPLLVKICGLKTPDALDAALDAGADMVGFVFFPPSPRNLGIEAARALGERVQGRAKKVALPIEGKPDLAPIRIYEKVADWLLFDARAPRGATRPGGLGKTFDWTLLENLDLKIPFMLSGGLDAANVAEALRVTHPPAVDVSSGVERAPGEKDPDKIREFIRAARGIAPLKSPAIESAQAKRASAPGSATDV